MIDRYLLRTVQVNGRVVYFWELNPEIKDTIVILHGIGGDHRGLTELGMHISKHRVIILDLPGYGLSEPLDSRYTFINFSKFLDAFVKVLELKQFVLLGHSYGGSIALKYADHYPAHLENLILINPISEKDFTFTAKTGRFLVDFACRFPDRYCKFLLSNKLFVYLTDRVCMTGQGKKRRKKILDDDYVNYKRADLAALKDGLQELSNIKLSSHILEFKGKSLIIGTNRDVLVSKQSVKRLTRIINNSILVLTSGGHLFPLEEPDVCGKIVDYYLSNHASIYER